MDETNNGVLDRGKTPLNFFASTICLFATIVFLVVDFKNPFMFVSALCCGFFVSRFYG